MMLDDYPDSFTLVEIQCDSAYATPWGDARKIFYGAFDTPWAWFDGERECQGHLGDTALQYDWYLAQLQARWTVPTDVTIELGAHALAGQTYRIQVRVCLEPGGTAKDVRVHVVQVLDYWPSDDNYTPRNGFKQAADPVEIHLTPGNCEFTEHDFEFDADSWGDQANIKIIAWVQTPNGSSPAEVHQAAVIAWPFEHLLEPGDTTMPFLDEFPTTTADPVLWTGVDGATVNDVAIEEPTLPYSLNLNGSATGGDAIRTARMDTSALPDVLLEYAFEQTGGGLSPAAGEDLVVEYLNSSLNWIEIARHLGSDGDMAVFSPESLVLTATDAFHPNFRAQFRVESWDLDADDWFIDNVYINAAPDIDPPDPDPMEWQIPPTPLDPSAITMTAAAATDHFPPVMYYFDAWDGGISSNWQTSNAYVDGEKDPNTLCTYQVQARDSAVPPNVGGFSDPVTTATMIETPAGLSSGPATESSIQVTALGTFTNIDAGYSGLLFQCVETSAASGWTTNMTWTFEDLASGTEYTFAVRARNQMGDETGSVQAYFSTTFEGTCPTQMGDVSGDGLVDGEDVAAFLRVVLDPPGDPSDQPPCISYGETAEENILGFIDDLLGQ
ncbi:MAG: hypothetical protein ABII12_07250 [Planctomycetota bacterium]